MLKFVRLAAYVCFAAVSSFSVAGTFSPRMVHSGVAQGQYPDAYLAKIAASGVDSVIVNITDPLTGAYAGGTEDLDSLIRRAAGHGIGIYAYADFPVLSEKLHPAEPGAREWYDKIYGGLVKNHPGLKGLIFVGESVAFPYRDHRPTHHWWRPCKGGADSVGFNPVPDWAVWLKLVKAVTRQYDPKIDLVFWTYNWFRKPEKDRLALLELLPTDVSLLVTFDMGDNKTRKCGIDMTVDDYSITVPGPGSTFASEAPVAKRRGIRLYSMTNTGGRTWDFGLLPYEPVPWCWKARFEAIREAREKYGLCGLMESHHYGFNPSFIFDLGTRIFADDYRPENFEKILRELAVRECGEACADATMAAWKDWSDAFAFHSSYWNDQYAVFRNGPIFPFCLPGAKIPDPLHPVYEYHDGIQHGNGWKYTIRTFEFEQDRLDGEEELATRELALLDRGVARLKGLAGARKQWALGSFMAATIRTSRNAKRYYRAGLAKDSKRMLEILDDEERNVRRCFDWVDVDPLIGWEPTMGRVVARDTLEWKLRQLAFARRDAAAVTKSEDKLRFVVIDPGHFHAALVFKNPYGDDVSTDVRVYAPKGAELDAYLALLKSFNARAENPTKWNVIVQTGDDYLDRAVAENKGDARVVTVLAGRNDLKAKYARTAVEAGWNVLADKPLAITPETAAELRTALALAKQNNLAFADIMTDRHEVLNLLQSALAHDAELFGEQEKGTAENPGVIRESVHHFFKLVNGAPLKRPDWYYDTDRQGAAIVDVTTHMADDVQWTVFPETAFAPSDVEVLSARRWPTPVSLADYSASTGRMDWPDFLRRKLDKDGVLPCDANGEFTYRIKDVIAKIKVEWRFRAPAGGGDTEYAVMRGTKASVGIRQTAADGFKSVLFVKGASGRSAEETRRSLEKALRRLSDRWPGLSIAVDGDGWKVEVPAKYSITHEAQFGFVAKDFLGWVRSGQPLVEYDNLAAKYETLIEAYEKSCPPVASRGASAADILPRWTYADDGRDILAKPLVVPMSAIPDLDAFTLEATLRFDERTDFTFFPLFDCTVSETGFGLALTFMSDRGNQVYLMENGQRRSVSYAMATVKPGETHTFVLTARKGWIVVYCDGVIQRRFKSRITPTPDPVTVGKFVDTHWGLGPLNFMPLVKPMKGVRLLSLKVWGADREYYAPGESREAVDGFVCGDGWMVEAPVAPDRTKPTLLYVGDSISDGYTPPIKRLASGKANLYHWTKCWREPSVVEPRQIAEVVACAKPDVIVFNNGLHSLHLTAEKLSDEKTVAAYRQLVSLFRAGAPKAKILYLNTTPNTAKAEADGKIPVFGPKNDAVLRLNRLAAQAMAVEKVPVIDAYSLMAARIPEARGDGYHWKPSAYEVLAAEVWRRVN